MKSFRILLLCLFIVSSCIISFEIIATRISSVIFVSNYAFIILSLAILGIGSGGIYTHFRIKNADESNTLRILSVILILLISSLIIFIIASCKLQLVTNPIFYFILLIVPFFLAGIFYSLVFKIYVGNSFKIYAADLSGAAAGSLFSIVNLNYFGAVNGVLILIMLVVISLIILIQHRANKAKLIVYSSVTIFASCLLIFNGNRNLIGNVPIGHYPEKDFYYVYPDAERMSKIVESQWSIYGRSDLVEYGFQDEVKQLFIDGAAGSPMYRFNGNVKKPGKLLLELLINQTNTIPFLFLDKTEKDNMLIIGPGGGKEVLIGLFQDVRQITGIEINPDFVDLVKKYKAFNGGIYSSFPNVNIIVAEGRHFIKRSHKKFDLIAMALPSTEQVQNIDAFAENENYLLTTEAIKDYLNVLTNEGQLIFTLHNDLELMRIITTAAAAFQENGISNSEFLDHIAIVEGGYTPTIVIKKNKFTSEQINRWKDILKNIPKDLPSITYLPYGFQSNFNSTVDRFISAIKEGISINDLIREYPYNLSPCKDDCPYFYKVSKGISDDYIYLFVGILLFSMIVIGLPFYRLRKKIKPDKKNKRRIKPVLIPLVVFICLGIGFMIIEISVFQKLILYLGSPTISLTILLSTLLTGMGCGSYYGPRIYNHNYLKSLLVFSSLIVVAGIIFFIFCPFILGIFLKFSLVYRIMVSVLMLLPFAFLLGIPFPTSLQFLKSENMQNLIPWMYGINGIMSVLGSVVSVILSMAYGFTITFFVGLFFYLIIFLIAKSNQDYPLVTG